MQHDHADAAARARDHIRSAHTALWRRLPDRCSVRVFGPVIVLVVVVVAHMEHWHRAVCGVRVRAWDLGIFKRGVPTDTLRLRSPALVESHRPFIMILRRIEGCPRFHAL